MRTSNGINQLHLQLIDNIVEYAEKSKEYIERAYTTDIPEAAALDIFDMKQQLWHIQNSIDRLLQDF